MPINWTNQYRGNLYKVLPGCNLGFQIDFTGMILEAKKYSPNLNCILFDQPKEDINGRNCIGVVSIGLEKLELIKEVKTMPKATISHTVSIHAKVSNSRITLSKFDAMERSEVRVFRREGRAAKTEVLESVHTYILEQMPEHLQAVEWLGTSLGKGVYIFSTVG